LGIRSYSPYASRGGGTRLRPDHISRLGADTATAVTRGRSEQRPYTGREAT